MNGRTRMRTANAWTARMGIGLILAVVAGARGEPATSSAPAGEGPVRVLMIVGGQSHDYEALPPKLAASLEQGKDITVRIVRDLAAIRAEEIAACDVLMVNTCWDVPLEEPPRRAIVDALRAGKGLVAMHCAFYSFQGWPEWRRIVGAVVRKHDPYGEFESVVVDRGHPITAGVRRRFAVRDEPYLAEDWREDNHVLVETARPHGGRSEPEPMAWTTRYAGGRVFSIMFGHDAASQGDPAIVALLRNGIRWAGGRLGHAVMLSERERREGFVPLFDGKTLADWRFDPKRWRVKDGIIIGDSRPDGLANNSFAITEQAFGDFVLRVSVRFISGNTGVQFRSIEGPDYTVSGYQSDVVLPTGWGNLHEQDGRRRLVDGWTGKAENVVNPADFNELEVVAQGPRIVLKTNGLVTADWTETDASRPKVGIIALQLHRGDPMEVHFTNIRIKPLWPSATRPGATRPEER